MPWIQVVVPRVESGQVFTERVAQAAAQAAGIGPEDVIVLVTEATHSHGEGAVATVLGRDRGADVEAALRRAVVEAVSEETRVPPDLVAWVRQPGV